MKTIRRFLRRSILLTAVIAFTAALWSRADLATDFHEIEGGLDDALLDSYSGTGDSSSTIDVVKSLATLKPYVRSPEALALLEIDQGNLSTAAQIGQARARIEHLAALEMLRCQKAGDLPQAQAWRTLITLPQFANSVSGEMLLQSSDIEQAKSSEVSHTLAREYLQWQTMRVRQLLDFLQEQVAQGIATKEVVEAYGAEIRALADFPASLLQAGGVKAPAVAAWSYEMGGRHGT